MAEPLPIWQPSDNLPPRIRRLRDEYMDAENRPYFRNESIPYTTGTPWDSVLTGHELTIAPDIVPRLKGFGESALAFARKLNLADDFFELPIVIRHAVFFKEALKVHPTCILDGDLIVGAHHATFLSNCLDEKEAKEWKEQEDAFIETVAYYIKTGVLNCGATQGHLIPGHKKALEIGLIGIEKEAKAQLEGASPEKRDFLQAVLFCIEGAKIFSGRYAAKAREMAEKELEEKRKKELVEIADICDRVPYHPPRSFHEALQSVWFTHALVMFAESYPGPGTSYGRFDQYMYPYYKNDIESGVLTVERAKELLMNFNIRHNYAYDAFGTTGGKNGINAGFGQLITLSGRGMNGEDLTNDLTTLILDVNMDMNLLEPKLNVRIHANTPDWFLDRLITDISRTQGSPFLLNFDSMSIKALEKAGLSHEDAVDYGVVGCLENTAQGKDRSGTVDVNINLAKAVEFALNRGKDMSTGDQIGVETPDPETFASFEDFKAAYFAQTKKIIELAVEAYNISDSLRGVFEPVPFLSMLVEGCIEKGKDVNMGGAVYNFITVEGVGFATAADSVIAVKHLVFDEKKITIKELVKALKSDFQEHPELRQMLLKAPKFGNDDDYADALAREASRFWAMEVPKYSNPVTGRKYRAGYLSWNYFINMGPTTASTPDGRIRGQFLSNAVAPVQGMDKSGPTAAFQSVTKLGFDVIPNGASYTVTFNPAMLRDKEHRMKFAALLRAYEELGGTALQTNVISRDTLLAAQKNPKDYENLLVRITGYNAYFTSIGKSLQDEVIARTQQDL
ncbi:MAG: pyruvate formate lyase family protein [Desulfobacterales bacterium]